jgi:hypothetical protein
MSGDPGILGEPGSATMPCVHSFNAGSLHTGMTRVALGRVSALDEPQPTPLPKSRLFVYDSLRALSR